MAEPTYVLISDNTVKVTGRPIACEKNVDYPSSYFMITHDKPCLNVYYKDQSLSDLRTSVAAGLLSGQADVTQAVAYLYKLFLPRTELNVTTWASYKIIIGSPNTTVNPFAPVKIIEHASKPVDLISTVNVNESFDKWIPYVIVFIFRASRVIHDTYRAILIENVRRQTVGLPDAISLDALCTSSGSWIGNTDYCKIVASLDMFYYRFSKSIHSNIRIGTIPSRYRECAALTSYQHLTKVVGSPTMGALFEWVFNHTVKDDILRIFKGGEELDQEFSYFPYQVDFGLVQKSAYSASVNSGLYVWGSIICVLNKDPQAQNARLLNFNSITDVVWNAKLLGYVKSNRVNTQVFFKEEGTEDPHVIESHTLTDMGKMPSGTNPVMWFNYMKSRNYIFPQECETFFASVKNSIHDPRTGTIAEYIKNTF